MFAIHYHRPKGLDDGAHVMLNTYECACGNVWEDAWDCGCDDECAACGAHVSPAESVDDPECDCEACEQARAIANPPGVNEAARALIDAYGGDVPDWLRAPVAVLEAALAREAASRAAIEANRDRDEA